MKIIDTKCFGIKVTLDTLHGGGTIASNLHGEDDHPQYKAAIDAVESLVLAHACAGIDITDPAYLEGIETAVEAIDHHLGD